MEVVWKVEKKEDFTLKREGLKKCCLERERKQMIEEESGSIGLVVISKICGNEKNISCITLYWMVKLMCLNIEQWLDSYLMCPKTSLDVLK